MLLAKYKISKASSGRQGCRTLSEKRRVSVDVRFNHISQYQIQANTQMRCVLYNKNHRKECKKFEVCLRDSCMEK